MTLEINKQLAIDAPVERVWSILADDFEHVYDWATGLESSDPNPKAPRQADGNAGGRVCEAPGFGFSDERVVAYEPAQHVMITAPSGLSLSVQWPAFGISADVLGP